MNDLDLDKKNKDFDKIRHFKSTWKDYEDFWKDKGARMSPWDDPEDMDDTFEDDLCDLMAVISTDDSYQFNEASVAQSAGMAIVFGSKILLGHATGKPWHTAYTIPKGGIDKGESILQAALRETYEEVGIKIPKKLIPTRYQTVSYVKSKKNRWPLDAPIGTHWKDVHYYVIQIDSLDQIGLNDEIIPKSNLQLKEVNWAGFMPIKEALKKISPVMKPIIESLMIYSNNKFLTFEQFKVSLDEDNMVALAGSQEDRLPIQKPFVYKTKKKRKGGNEDDEEDDTQAVANTDTISLGKK